MLDFSDFDSEMKEMKERNRLSKELQEKSAFLL